MIEERGMPPGAPRPGCGPRVWPRECPRERSSRPPELMKRLSLRSRKVTRQEPAAHEREPAYTASFAGKELESPGDQGRSKSIKARTFCPKGPQRKSENVGFGRKALGVFA